ncbi:MAG: DUF4145 domain-containing protein [Candidatus Aenigmarchaeota archaeon]|nr:DUF4145 domain-containing protein [Candidatus Aenigmarchaeota archaeon]
MVEKYYPPAFYETSFNCPHCRVYSRQVWSNIWREIKEVNSPSHIQVSGLISAFCEHCKEFSLWLNGEIVYPELTSISPPNEDLSESIKQDYLEAGSIVNKSPRGAAALLRLSIEKLVNQLESNGKDLNEKIGLLVDRGLPTEIQQSLDILRVIGNNAVHPGQLDLKDDIKTATRLFEIVNIIAQDRITNPKQIKEIYSKLPKETLESIKKRDE